jgi:hypothetical protein
LIKRYIYRWKPAASTAIVYEHTLSIFQDKQTININSNIASRARANQQTRWNLTHMYRIIPATIKQS